MAQPAQVQIIGLVQRTGGFNLWSIGSPACSGPPGFCPAFLTATHPGVIMTLNAGAAARQALAVSGTALPPSQSIGGLPVVLVTSAKLTGLDALLRPFGR